MKWKQKGKRKKIYEREKNEMGTNMKWEQIRTNS